jgi:hypothetical protein
MVEAVHWGKPGARLNTISPWIVMTPFAKDELSGSRGGLSSAVASWWMAASSARTDGYAAEVRTS